MQISDKSIIYVPDGIEPGIALARTTHMAIVAHQDDAETIAHDIIARCYDNPREWFTAVIVTDGAGSTKTGQYAGISEKDLIKLRNTEQKEAARTGDYGALIILGHPSSDAKKTANNHITDEIARIIKWAKPDIIYTHNPFDSHDTHVAVMLRTIDALRFLQGEYNPDKLIGCEVWRSLDWLLPEDRLVLDVSLRPELAGKLLGVFKSQLGSGKRYDKAVIGRRQANATFDNARTPDASGAVTYAIDLTLLIENPGLDVSVFARKYMDRFRDDVINRIEKFGGI
jgi:LmbE family N-acetylglucosaminyl deacetylase